MAKNSPALPPLKLQGQKVHFAGRHWGDTLKQRVLLEGGEIVDELTDAVNVMVLGYNGNANPTKKAAKLNAQGASIQVVDQTQFAKSLLPTPDEAVDLLRGGPEGIKRWNDYANDFAGVYHQWMSPTASSPAYIRMADLSGFDLSGANLGAGLEACDLRKSTLSRCQLRLINCQLEGAKVHDAEIVVLTDCDASNVEFLRDRSTPPARPQFVLVNSNVAGCRFHGGLFQCRKSNFDDARFIDAELFSHSAFEECSLKHANFSGAKLESANFLKADLTGANFTNANLTLANFDNAVVDDADFTGATMVGVDVGKAYFDKAKVFDVAQTQSRGQSGDAVKEFVAAAGQSQRLATTINVTRGGKASVLSVVHSPYYTQIFDDAGGRFFVQQGQALAPVWSALVARWQDATPDFGSLTLRATKAQLSSKELKQIAARAWAELFGVEVPSEETLKTAAKSSKAKTQEAAEEWFATLRSGKAGVEKWNESPALYSRQLAKVSAVNLAGAALAGLVVNAVEWKNADFSKADLSNADLKYCRFPGGDFSGATLSHAHFTGSQLIEANLQGASAIGCPMDSVSLKRAQCQNADFTAASLRHADLCGADFTGANLTNATLDRASYDEHTVLPKKFTPTLEMIWKGPGTSPAAHKMVQKTKPKGKLDIEQFMTRLEELTDAAKLKKALSMLKADRFKLYAQVTDDHFVGVVKSQGDADLVYSCRLNADGTYACCTQNLNVCGGLRGSLCKHLLVLIVGLTKNGELDPNAIDTWIRLSKTNKPALDKDAMSETFLRYKGAEAGEVDWRPTETIPEDYYAM